MAKKKEVTQETVVIESTTVEHIPENTVETKIHQPYFVINN